MKLVLKHTHLDEWQHAEIKQEKDRIHYFLIQATRLENENLRIKVGSSYLNSSISIINQGLILENTLGMEKQVNSICKTCYYEI